MQTYLNKTYGESMFFDISLQIYQFITCWKTCFYFWFACSQNLPVKSIGTHSSLSVGNGKERRYPIFLKIGERIKMCTLIDKIWTASHPISPHLTPSSEPTVDYASLRSVINRGFRRCISPMLDFFSYR